MAISAVENYGTKAQHGLKWGIHRFVGGAHRIRLRELGGDCERLPNQDLSLCDSHTELIIMGNVWVHKDPRERTLFRHPDQIAATGATAYYWDNPLLPHLLYRGEWNPMGHKNWLRIVKNDTAPKEGTSTGHGERVINQQLKLITNGRHTVWQSTVGTRRPVSVRSKTALLCPSGAGIFENYYGTTKRAWIEDMTQKFESLGWRVIMRDKPSRSLREVNNGKLYEQLLAEPIGCTVSIHSVGPVESLLAGVPAVVSGRHAGGPCATPLEEFLETKQLRLPHESDCDAWVSRLLDDTYHKTEAYDGSWHGRNNDL